MEQVSLQVSFVFPCYHYSTIAPYRVRNLSYIYRNYYNEVSNIEISQQFIWNGPFQCQAPPPPSNYLLEVSQLLDDKCYCIEKRTILLYAILLAIYWWKGYTDYHWRHPFSSGSFNTGLSSRSNQLVVHKGLITTHTHKWSHKNVLTYTQQSYEWEQMHTDWFVGYVSFNMHMCL
jgi:hypothetical protein